MATLTGHRDKAVSEVIDSCLVYWVSAGLPRPQAETMAEELGSHLQQALADGKSVWDVVGNDIARFAEESTREVRRPRPWHDRILEAAAVLLQAALIPLLPTLWTDSARVESGHLAQILCMATAIFVLVSPRWGGRGLANSADRRQALRWEACLG